MSRLSGCIHLSYLIMRTCVVIAFLVILAFGRPAEKSDTINAAHNDCQSNPNTHIDEGVLHRISRGEDIDNVSVRAHVLCVSKKLGLLNEDGKVNRSNLRMVLSGFISDEGKLEETMENCIVEKDDAEDTALALDKCFQNNYGGNSHTHHHNN